MTSQRSRHHLQLPPPDQVVVTKIDKCSQGALLTNLLNLQGALRAQTSCCFPQPLLVR